MKHSFWKNGSQIWFRFILLLLISVETKGMDVDPALHESVALDAMTKPSELSDIEQVMKRELLDSSIWPFSGKNQTDTSCGGHKSCTECSTSSSWCHWCGHDKTCHEIGSAYGCFEGTTCANKTQPHKEDKGCGVHTNCGECAVSSVGCHWCASDNACHAVGSIYGCISGVDCYSNDRCRRQEPTPIKTMTFQEMGFMPILVVFLLGSICFCCSTLGFCVAGGVKGAYDDLVEAATSNSSQIQQQQQQQQQQQLLLASASAAAVEIVENHESFENTPSDDTPLLSEDIESASDYNLMTYVDPRHPPMHPYQIRYTRSRGSKHMNCLFNACRACYVINVLTILAFVIGSIRYYPKIPQYNICNDSIAWKSLVDSMTSMSIEGSFEILASVMNPNHFDVAVDMGRGTFKHNGADVGTFVMPPTVISAMSITDLTIIASFTPEKWEALSLSAEYYRGTLAFTIDAQYMIRVPVLFDYSKEADLSNMYVKVNDPNLKDRHLCACPNWDDIKNKTRPLLL